MILFVTIWQLRFYITFYFLHFGANLIDRIPPQIKQKINETKLIKHNFCLIITHGITMIKLLKTVLSYQKHVSCQTNE